MTTNSNEIEQRGETVVIIGIRAGMIGMIMGVHDWDASRLDEATKMVLYIYAGRQTAQSKVEGLRTVKILTEEEVDAHIHVKHTVSMGGGVRPSRLLYPIKVELHAPHGFAKDPMRTFDDAVDIILDDDWLSTPALRDRPKPTSGGRGGGGGINADAAADELVVEEVPEESPFDKRLPAAPRMVYDGTRSYTPPSFQVPVTGYQRRTSPGKVFVRADGSILIGKRDVDGYVRNKDAPARPEGAFKRKSKPKTEPKTEAESEAG